MEEVIVSLICDMIYMLLFAQKRGLKAELQCTIWDRKEKEKTPYDQKQS